MRGRRKVYHQEEAVQAEREEDLWHWVLTIGDTNRATPLGIKKMFDELFLELTRQKWNNSDSRMEHNRSPYSNPEIRPLPEGGGLLEFV